ncbi:MAG TPA: DUF1456 domain-containing protein [Gammaproteobacteria bacterium]|nr:hypothetical protein [Gammaproteobacteria bacterium]MEC8009342.1 DUF1456 family protein [Pseudomonadota bacterium]HBF08722.1 DUF1456 domain-containing protein [Gammaproteobacteria bacterium]HCK92811.1 DUF1456 domain-containing protein [Gammaproteobacteria bacterium]
MTDSGVFPINNNDILFKVRSIFGIELEEMIDIFELGGLAVTEAEVKNLLARAGEKRHTECTDQTLAHFLNGFIALNRGYKDDIMPEAETQLTNNMILRKIRIALDLQADDLVELFQFNGINLSRHELSAMFRSAGHKKFKECSDKMLGSLLDALEQTYNEEDEEEGDED